MTVGQRIQNLRKSRKMTRDDLADILTVPPRTLGGWEREERGIPIDILIKIADYFSVSTDYLLGRTDQPLFQQSGPGFVELTTDNPNAQPAQRETNQVQVQKKLNGLESHEELEALIRKMIDEVLLDKK